MKIVSAIHILQGSEKPVATYTREAGWQGRQGKWSATGPEAHPADPDPLRSYAAALGHYGLQVSIDESEGGEESVAGRVY